jgi:YVTN family beta-propeller protein
MIGCSTPETVVQPTLETEGELLVYLQPLPQPTHHLRFTIDQMFAVDPDGARIPLDLVFADLRGKDLIGRQTLLARGILPPGTYFGLALWLKDAFLLGEEGENALFVPDRPVRVDRLFKVMRREATALFLSLDATNMTAGNVVFEPVFSLAQAGRQLANLNGYISIPNANRLTVFNKSSMQVINVIATGLGPTGLAIDRLRRRVYVACSGQDRIEEIDMLESRVVERIALRMGDGPLALAISPDGRTLVSANNDSNTASILDLRSRIEIARLSVGRKPTDVVIDDSGRFAFVVNSLSNTVSVIDLPQSQLVAVLDVETTPLRAALVPDSRRLFVINRDSPNLSVVSSERLTLIDRIFAGAGSVSITSDPSTRLLYVGNVTGDIGIVDPSALMFIDTISSRGAVAYLTIDKEQNSLFALRSETGTLQKINPTSKRILAEIEVDEGAYAVAVVGER